MSEPKEADARSEEGVLLRDRVMAMVLIGATLITFYLCYLVLSPFLPALAFALALAVVARPLHVWLVRRIRKPGLAAGITDPEVADAMRYAFSTLKLVLEPAGSVGLAALLTGKIPAKGKTVGLILSGGNVDPDLFARVIRSDI